MVDAVKTTIAYSHLPTEQNNPASRNIDRVSIAKALRIINQQDQAVARAVQKQLPAIEKAVVTIVGALKKGGRLIFIGAGTSGRLGILEAAECPPTFNTPPSMVQAFMAGGRSSVFRSKEGAEDRGKDAVRIIARHIKRGDVVVGIAASGVTPFVRDGLKEAKRRGARTVLVTCHPTVVIKNADHVIKMATGPEVIAGSTRLKAGTATKLALNSLTVASMVQLGKVYGNRMVDLQPRSAKLRARAIRLISFLGGVSELEASRLLAMARGNAKTAIVMAKKRLSYPDARRRLASARGHLHRAL